MPNIFRAQRQRKPDSRDYGLFVVFTVGTFIQMVLPVNGLIRCGLAIAWAGVLINSAMKHREYHQWQWQGTTKASLLKSILGALIGVCFYPIFVIRSVDHMGVDSVEWSPNTILEYLTQTAQLFSQLLVSTEPLVGFLLIPIGWGIFMVLVNLKVAYLYDDDFQKDCNEAQSSEQRKANSISISSRSANRIMAARFFYARPFVLSKQRNLVRISFYKISSQDISENVFAVAFSCLIFLFFVAGAVNMVRFGLLEPTYGDSMASATETSAMIGAMLIPCFFFVVGALLFWVLFVSHFFAIRTIEFRSDKLIMRESVLGFSRRLLRVYVDDLQPLVERRRSTKIPEVRNTALIIDHRGRQVEIAGQLLPEAMDSVQNTYDIYCESDFNQFYNEAQPVLIS
ncbi:MAG: hypothetical protein AAFP20_24200 [Cyanobacteria bacterium J06614_10]